MTSPFSSCFWLSVPIFLGLLPGTILLGFDTASQSSPQATINGYLNEDVLVARQIHPFTGDLDIMQENHRPIRALVNYSKTGFFLDGARMRGIHYEGLNEYEKFINKNVKNRSDRTNIVFIPMPFVQLLPSLEAGLGDIAIASLTITPEREERVAFSSPFITGVDEVIVTHKTVPKEFALEDLAGKQIIVRAGSSYLTHIKALSQSFEKKELPPIDIVEADKDLSIEDLMELVHAGVLEYTIVDAPIAEVWAQVLSEIVVRSDLVVHSGNASGWAVRKSNPKLLASINEFVSLHKERSAIFNILFQRYYKNTKWIKNPLASSERKKLENVIELFEQYGDQYNFDPFMILALAYQESRLDQSVRSSSGAIGIMQVLPSTAADRHVGIPDIDSVKNNVHAGVKYMRFIRGRYFSSPQINPAASVDFTFAAYNAGPGKVARMRKAADQRGLDGNLWFGNVERIAAEIIGRETVDYVSNINKYYMAYKLFFDAEERRNNFRKTAPVPLNDM